MQQIDKHHLVDDMLFGKFKEKVKNVTHPIRSDPDAVSNVGLRGTPTAVDNLTSAERVYAKWFSYRSRLQDMLPVYFRCLGFHHRIADFKTKDNVYDVWPE